MSDLTVDDIQEAIKRGEPLPELEVEVQAQLREVMGEEFYRIHREFHDMSIEDFELPSEPKADPE